MADDDDEVFDESAKREPIMEGTMMQLVQD